MHINDKAFFADVSEKLRTEFAQRGLEDESASILLWWECGCHPGSYLEAVLSNDLVEALSRSGESETSRLRKLVTVLFCHLPKMCWGDRERFRQWRGWKVQFEAEEGEDE